MYIYLLYIYIFENKPTQESSRQFCAWSSSIIISRSSASSMVWWISFSLLAAFSRPYETAFSILDRSSSANPSSAKLLPSKKSSPLVAFRLPRLFQNDWRQILVLATNSDISASILLNEASSSSDNESERGLGSFFPFTTNMSTGLSDASILASECPE